VLAVQTLASNSAVVCNCSLFAFISLTLALTSSVAHLVCNINLLGDGVPYLIYAVSVIKSFKNAITTDHDEVEIILYSERFDVWVTDDDIWVATVLGSFGFDVAKGLAHTQTTREDTEGPLNIHVLLTWVSSCLCKSLGPVDLTSSSLNPNLLQLIIWLVISTQNSNLTAGINAHHCS